MITVGRPPAGGEVDPAQVEGIVTPLVEGVATAKSRVVVDEFSSGVASFEALRARQPRYEGERVMLKQYNASSGKRGKGGGWFIGHLTAATDDGGYTAAGSGFHWIRDKDFSDLSVLDFGAMQSTTFDSGPAAVRMYEFMLGKANPLTDEISQDIRITFPAGKFLINPVDLTKYGTKVPEGADDAGQNPSGYYAAGAIIIEGVSKEFGKIIGTTFISDKSDNIVFHLNHRFMFIRGIIWDGQQTVVGDSTTRLIPGSTQGVFNEGCSNKQPFLKNDCPAGTFARINCFKVQNTGNYGCFLLDTLDTKIDQVYGSNFAGPAFVTGWSDPLNQYYGKWDHSTALEMTNFNFQKNWCPAFVFPRMGQGLLYNGWVEHGNMAYDINCGQWLIDAVSVEDCLYNGSHFNNRNAAIRQFSGPTGNDMDFKTSPSSADWKSYPKNPDGSDITAWQGGYETGYSRLEAAYSHFNHPVKAQWYTGVLRGSNNVAAPLWINIGALFSPAVGQEWEFEFFASNYNGVSAAPLNVLADRSPGKTVILVQRGTGLVPKVTYYHVGNSAVTAVQYQAQQYNTDIPAIWVRVDGYTGEWMVNAKSTGKTRQDDGTCTLFKFSGATQTASPGLTNAVARMSMHNGLAGFGSQDDLAGITTRTVNSSLLYLTTPVTYKVMNINGVEVGQPYYAYKPAITTQPVTQNLSAGATLTLAVVATRASSYQWYKDGAAISGATSATYNKSGVTVADAGNYYCVVGADPTGNTVQSSTVAVDVA